ncbi:ABC transporter permease [Streptomyces collinus]|uniref:ABC transporter permease n=1 Tax=Streptomyces collinus TaxID=42684 RepID=UPI0036960B4A
MSATTAPAAVRPAAARPRLVRWLLRLHRPALLAWTALVVLGAALLLWLAGPLTDAAAEGWRQYDACGYAPKCAYDQDAILRYKDWYGYATTALDVLPLVVAAWAGAALTGRELESGTARLAWAQSTAPARWLAVRLAVPAAAVTTGTCLLFWLHHRVWTAGRGRIDTAKSWADFGTFYANGPAVAGLAVAGLAAGVLAGLLLRRTLPALVTGTLATAGVWGLAHALMPHLWPAVTAVGGLDRGVPGTGIVVEEGLVTRSGAHLPLPRCGSSADCDTAYAHAVGQFRTYHPYAHYWPLQLVTTALLLAVAGLLVLGSFLVLRRLAGPKTGESPA